MDFKCLWYTGPLMYQKVEDHIGFEQGHLRYECHKGYCTASTGFEDISFPDQVRNHLMNGPHNHRMTPINQETVERDEDYIYDSQGENAIKTYWGCCCCMRYYEDKQQFVQHFEAAHVPNDESSDARDSNECNDDEQEKIK